MTGRGRRLHALGLMAAAMAALAPVPAGGAPSPAPEAPSVSVDRRELRPGDAVVVTLRGFRGQLATVAVCGNLGKRGSTDCSMTAAQGERIRPGVATLTQLSVQPPPAPCPCVIRASSPADEFAVVLIDLIGHPSGPVVDVSDDPLVDVGVETARTSQAILGRLRSALGGPTPYDVTVSVRNRTTGTLSAVALSASARHRLSDEAASLVLPAPGDIAPGETWSHTARATIPAPAMGRYVWVVTASGAGNPVVARQRTDVVPPALVLGGVLLLADLSVILWRRRSRHRSRRPAVAASVAVPS